MQGFQPLAQRGLVHRATNPQHLADGGQVAFGARGLSGLRDLVPQMAAMGFSQAAPAPAPAADPRAAQLQAMIPRMEAMGYKQQRPQYLAKGGLVRGPGTGTSDSIETEAEPGTFIMPADSTAEIGPSALEKMGTVPVRLSDGEFKLPPEQIMALGVAVLKLMKDATHTPVNGEDGGQTAAEVGEGAAHERAEAAAGGVETDAGEGAQGFQPGARERMARMPMYADGGMVENDVLRIGNSYSGGNVGGAITVNGAAPAGTFSENPGNRLAAVPTPAPSPTTVSVIRATQPALAPAAAADPSPAPAPMGWQARQDQRNLEVTASSIVDSPERRAAQQRLGTLPAAGFQPRRYADGGVVEDDLQKLLEQIPSSSPPGWTGGGLASAATPAAPSPAPVASPAPSAPQGALSRAASLAPPTPAVETMSTPPQPRPLSDGAISTQNMDADQGLPARGAAGAMSALPAAPAPIQAQVVRHSGNDWQARKDLENARTSALSITNRPEWSNSGMNRFRGGQAGPSPDVAAYNAMLSNDLALRGAQPSLDQAAMRENAENLRSGQQVAAASANSAADRMAALDRTLITERGNNMRSGLSAMATTEAARIKAAQENKPPAGYRWGAGGSLEAIPGGPAAAKVAEDQKTKDSALDASRQTIGTINRLLASPGREGATGTWNLGRFVPGTNAADFAAEVETLKAQTFLPMVQQLRGMGALSNAEGDKLNAAVGALNFNMSEKAFQESLGRIRDQFGTALQRSGVDTKDFANWGLEPPTSAAEQGARPAGAPAAAAPQRSVTRSGVFNGRKVVQYSDGSTEYAD